MSLFGQANAWMHAFGRRALQPLQKQSAALTARIRALIDSRPSLETENHAAMAEEAVGAMKAAALDARNRLGAVKATRPQAYEHLRMLQWVYNTTRPAASPDMLLNAFVLVLCALIEGLGAGALMAADGKMPPAIGVAYGLAFAGTNIAVAGLAGFIARYFHFRTMPGASDPAGGPMRIAAGLGFVAACGFLLVLLFSAARTRATGSHSGIFDFSALGFWATFDDSLALALIALGVVGSVIGAIKGYAGIYDKYPGYTQAQRAAREHCDDLAEEIVEEREDTIEAIHDEATKDFKKQRAADVRAIRTYNRKLARLRKDILNHNKKVEQARARYRSYRALVESGTARVTGGNTAWESPFDDADFDAEQIDPAVLEGQRPLSVTIFDLAFVSIVRAGRDHAMGLLKEAHARFLAEGDHLNAAPTNSKGGGKHGPL